MKSIQFSKTISISKYALILCILGIYVFTFYLREQIIVLFTQRSYLWAINVLAWLGIVLLFLFASDFTSLSQEKIFIPLSLLIMASTPAIFISYRITNPGLGYFIVHVTACVLPVFLLFLQFKAEEKEYLIKSFLLFFNFFTFFHLLWAVIDKLFDRIILKWVSSWMTYREMFHAFAYDPAEYLDHNRFMSFIGNPLMNAALFNMFLVLNILYSQYTHKKLMGPLLTVPITLIGVICCGSKVGLLASLLIIFITYFNNLKIYILLIFSAFIAFITGIFENLINRFLYTPIATGRIDSIRLLSDSRYPLHFWYGYGDVHQFESYNHAAVEMAPINFLFAFGIFFTICILGVPLFYMTYRLLRHKKVLAWLLWGVIFGEICSFTSIADAVDDSLLFYFFSMILLNIASISLGENVPNNTP